MAGLNEAYYAGATIAGMTSGLAGMGQGALTQDGETYGLAGTGTVLTYAGSFSTKQIGRALASSPRALSLGLTAAKALPVVGAIAAGGTLAYDSWKALSKAGCF